MLNDLDMFDFQIINDHNVRGKCYGFVTFSNPRSAQQAINDMDGKVYLYVSLTTDYSLIF